MSKVAKVLFPDGKLCVIKEVEAYCEQVVEIADKTIRLMEKAKDFCENPTALVFNVEERDDDIFMPMKSRKVVGNLPTALCKDLMRELLIKGYYDFSDTVGMKIVNNCQDKIPASFSYYCPTGWGITECSNILVNPIFSNPATQPCGELVKPKTNAEEDMWDYEDYEEEGDDEEWGDYDE